MDSCMQPSLHLAMPASPGLSLRAAPKLLIVDDQPLMAEYIASLAE